MKFAWKQTTYTLLTLGLLMSTSLIPVLGLNHTFEPQMIADNTETVRFWSRFDSLDVPIIRPTGEAPLGRVPSPTRNEFSLVGWFKDISELGEDEAGYYTVLSGSYFFGSHLRPQYQGEPETADYYAVWADASCYQAAVIDEAHGSAAVYEDLDTAVMEAKSTGAIVKLLADVTADTAPVISVKQGETLILDLNGFDLEKAGDPTGYFFLENWGTLTIENSGNETAQFQTTGDAGGCLLMNHADAVVPMIQDIVVDAGSAFENHGTIETLRNCEFLIRETTINSGQIQNLCADFIESGFLNGGSFLYNTGFLHVTGGSFTFRHAGSVLHGGGAVTFPDHQALPAPNSPDDPSLYAPGRYTLSPLVSVSFYDEDAITLLGVYEAPLSASFRPAFPGAIPTKPDDSQNGTLCSYQFTGWKTAEGEILSSEEIALLKKDTKLYAAYTAAKRPPVAQVEKTVYPSLSTAIQAVVESGQPGTIQLLSNIEIFSSEDTMFIPPNSDITLDLQGKRINLSPNVSAPVIVNQGTLLLRNGTICSQSSPCLSIQDGAVILESGQVDVRGKSCAAIEVSGGSLLINDGYIVAAGAESCGLSVGGSGIVTIVGNAKVSGQASAVRVREETATVVLSGGYFRGGIQGAVSYGDGMSLSAISDEEGYFHVAAPQQEKLPPIVTGDSASVTVPEDMPIEPLFPVTLSASTGSDAVKHARIVLPAKVVQQLGLTPSLTLQTDMGHIVFDAEALQAMLAGAGPTGAAVSLSELSCSQLPEAQQNAAESAQKILDISLTSGDKSIDISHGTATVRLPFSPTTGLRPEDYCVYSLSDTGVKTAVPFQYGDGMITFFASHFSIYCIDSLPSYQIVLSTDLAHYNVGEIITASVWSSFSQEVNVTSFQFTPSFDPDRLELIEVISDLSGWTVSQTGIPMYSIQGKDVAFNSEPTRIASISFRVKDTPSLKDTVISLADASMSAQGTISPSQITGKEVALHHIQVVLQADDNSAINGHSALTLYAKYNQVGLYQTPYADPVTSLPLIAKEGYRLADRHWTDGASEYDSFDDLTNRLYTQNARFTAQTVKTCTISFTPGSNGSLSSFSPMTVDAGTQFSSVSLPKPTGQNGYTFTGWYADGKLVEQDCTITENITLTPQFSAFLFRFNSSSPNATLHVLTGLTEDQQVTYGVDVTFQVTPNKNYFVSEASFTVENQTHILTPDDKGLYTISGEDLQGDVTVKITALPYCTLTFEAAKGTSMTSDTAYIKPGATGLYSDITFTTPFSPPMPTALPGYRLAEDTPQEPLWQDESGAAYTSSSLSSTGFTESQTLRPRVIPTWRVSFQADEGGTLSNDIVLTVDTGAALTVDQFPTPAAQTGYVFDRWFPDTETLITQDTVFTAHFCRNTHAIDFCGDEATVYQILSGVEEGQAQYGRDVTFTLSIPPEDQASVFYTVGDSTHSLKAVDGIYTIPGAEITGQIRVFVTTQEMVTVTFQAGEHGSLTGPAVITVEKGAVLTAAQIPIPQGAAEYHFVSWSANGAVTNPVGYLVTGPITFTAIFDKGSLPVTVPPGLTGTASTASYGVPFTFTPGFEGHLVTNVCYTVGGGELQALLPNPDGSYTIPADQVTGPIAITADFVKGSITFVSYEHYKATPPGKQMVVLKSAQLTDRHYILSDDTPFYWSPLYGAYVRFVDGKETAASLAAKLTTTSGPAVTLNYRGDLNQSGTVTQDDGNLINDLLHGVSSQLDDKLRLEMDVNGSLSVTTSDIQWIFDASIGKIR